METALNPGMCRCCASEGAFKDIKSTYHWMGEEEVYADMLRECFDVILNASGQGEDSGICEVCITQLRNAINFKKQVLHTEEQFQKHLQNKTLFRPNIVKVEMQGEEESDDNMASGDEGFSGAEYEVPIKTELEDPKPKKRAAKAAATTTRASAKKAKADNGETSTKRLSCDTEINLETDVSKIMKVLKARRSAKTIDNKTHKASKKSSNQALEVEIPKNKSLKTDLREIDKHLQNIRNILFYSNATPIKKHTGNGYLCGFCEDYFTMPRDLKEHTLQTHGNETKSSFMKGSVMFFYVVKLDITDLKCEICQQDIEGLEPLMAHLQYDHHKIIHKDIKNHILPFKFEGDTLKCVLCPTIFDHFKLLQEHMNVHYGTLYCKICNSAFINKGTLKCHEARHKQGEFSCSFCSKVFDTNIRMLCHEKYTHILGNKRNKCAYCEMKFISYSQRNEHMVKVHGTEQRVHECKACDMTFNTKESLTQHTKRIHLLEKNEECELCDMKFFRKKDLIQHILKHTGEKQFSCDICLKAFGRKDHLKQHLKIHLEDRKYRCEECGHAFVQKGSLKSHLRSRHGTEVKDKKK